MDDYIAELKQTLDQVNTLMGLVRSDAQAMGIDSMALRSTDGGYVMAPLITAKSNILPALISAYIFRSRNNE